MLSAHSASAVQSCPTAVAAPARPRVKWPGAASTTNLRELLLSPLPTATPGCGAASYIPPGSHHNSANAHRANTSAYRLQLRPDKQTASTLLVRRSWRYLDFLAT